MINSKPGFLKILDEGDIMNIIQLDTYTIKARLCPVFLVILPVLITINLWAPKTSKFQFGFSSVIFSLAISFFGAQFGRHGGKLKEIKLWKSWDGPPTIRFLRYRDKQFNSIRKMRYHRIFQKLIPDINIPTMEQEMSDPLKADQVYEACIRFLIAKTRDIKKFSLVYKENTNYGFLRNLWGLKPLGIFLSLLSLINCGYFLWVEWSNKKILPETIILTLIVLCILALWITWVRPAIIKIAAEAYAERLLECCENIENK
jgi:hypothetical protein